MSELTFTEICDDGVAPGDSLTLPFEDRQKARQRVSLDSGRMAGLKLSRGTVLRGGDRVRSATGEVVEIVAAEEAISTVHAQDPVALARAAYHLGNRHVWVQVGDGWLRYLADHVLDDMVRKLGVSVEPAVAPFEPEAGAYSSHESTERHSHDHPH